MATPTILVNSGTGSDTAASGAGPATALTGTGASLASSTSADLSVDAPDLSGVATDGSACLWVNTASGRQFSRITNVNNSTKIVTVATTYSVTASGLTWAIGGKRASIGGTNSRKLLENGTSFDAEAGWTIEMESGHAETVSGPLNVRNSGTRTTGAGRVTLRGTLNAATVPILTFSNNSGGITFPAAVSWLTFSDFEVRNSNGTKTASVAFLFNASVNILSVIISNITCTHATNYFWKFLHISTTTNCTSSSIVGCTIKNCGNVGIHFASTGAFPNVIGNLIKSCGSHGIHVNECTSLDIVAYNICAGNGGSGARLRYRQRTKIFNNTFDGNTAQGLYLELDPESANYFGYVCDNIFSNNGAYGLNMFDGATQEVVNTQSIRKHNCYYNNTSGKINLSSLTTEDGESTVNPTYANTSIDDYTPTNTALVGVGWPGSIGGVSNYPMIGAVTPEVTGGGGLAANPLRGFIL